MAKKKKQSLLKKTATRLKEAFYGKKTYAKKKFKPSRGSPAARGETGKDRGYDSERLKNIEEGLRRAGLTKKEIERFTSGH